MAGSAREEAERLVATILAMAGAGDQGEGTSGTKDRAAAGFGAFADSLTGAVTRLASGQASGSGWSTGSAECCVCPVCRAIAAVRDPSPEATERVATGAGDIAMGVAGVMRGFAAMSRSRPAPRRTTPPKAQPPNADETWSTATRRSPTHNSTGTAWSAATNSPAAAPATPGDAPAGAQEPASKTRSAPAGAEFGRSAAGADAWSQATTASAAAAAAEAETRRAAAQRAAAEAAAARAAAAADRVAQAVALAEAARTAATASAATHEPGATRSSPERGAAHPRTDVWAAATADAGVADVARPGTVDHDVPGASAPEGRGGVAGDEARDGDPA